MYIVANKRKACFLATAVLMLASARPAWSAVEPQTARKQIYSQATVNATADIQRVARQKNWQGYSSKLNVFIPTEVSRFPRCDQPLISSLPAGDRLDLARLRYDIRCEGANRWEIAVTVKPDIYLPILVAKTSLERGKQLAASDVELKKRNISGMRDGYISRPDEVLGLTVKKRIRDMQAISPAQLEQPLVIERGQRVVMIAAQDGIEAKSIGEAMKKGRKGDVIKVRNLSSQKVVSALVDDVGVVRMLLAPGS